MLEHETEALRTIRNILGMLFGGHDALAEQVRQIGDQVERLAKDNAALRASAQESVLKAMAFAINTTVDTSLLTRKQLEVMCARLAFVREVERQAGMGLAKTVVVDSLLEASHRGELAPHLAPLVGVANDRSGGKRGLSKRSLVRWCCDFAKGGAGALAPSRPGHWRHQPPSTPGQQSVDPWSLFRNSMP